MVAIIATDATKKTADTLNKLRFSWMEVTYLVKGRQLIEITTAKMTANTTMINVSPIICQNNCLLLPPRTFLIPTSLERPTACAVERLMKLIQAIMTMNKPISDNVHKVVLLA